MQQENESTSATESALASASKSNLVLSSSSNFNKKKGDQIMGTGKTKVMAFKLCLQ